MNNKTKIGIGMIAVSLFLAGIMFPASTAQGEKVNGVARINYDYVLAQDPVTNNVTGNSNVVFFNLTGGATYTLVRAVVPIDIKPGLSEVNRQKEYGRQIKAWALQNTIYNITKVQFFSANTIDV